MSIVANLKETIGQLFHRREPFIIPPYQRPYSWGAEEITAFCDDIKGLSKSDEYFFGGIVSVSQDTNDRGHIYQVVDGQQRLTTFTLTIFVLRCAFDTLEKSTTNPVIKECCAGVIPELTDLLTYHAKYAKPPRRLDTLTLSKIDKDYFTNLINNSHPQPSTIPSHKNLLIAKQLIHNKLFADILTGSCTDDQKYDALINLKDILLEHCVVIHIVTNDLNEAYQLFEVLNDRGKDLAVTDYLRCTTLLFTEGHPEIQEKINLIWNTLASIDNPDKFIKAFLNSHIGISKRSNLHSQFSSKFLFKGITANQIFDMMSNLNSQYTIYKKIINGEWPYSSSKLTTWKSKRLYNLIKELDHSACIPFFMALFEKYSNTTDELIFYKVVDATEKFVFRYITVCGSRANKLTEVYKNSILDLRNDSFEITSYFSSLKDLITTSCSDVVFKDALENKFIYSDSNISKIRYFLSSLEYYYSWYQSTCTTKSSVPQASENIIYTIDINQIEHIYPQNAVNIDPQLESVKHNIGNLSFWSNGENIAASNLDFISKLPFYKNSNIKLTSDICHYSSWDISQYELRKNILINMALEIFSIH